MEPDARVDPSVDKSPIYEKFGRWFFWDETWTDVYGPFRTEVEARIELLKYASWLDAGETTAGKD